MIFCWLAFGLVVLYSASLPSGLHDFNDPLHFIKLQVFFAICGLIIFGLTLRTPLSHWWRWTPAYFGGILLALLATRLLGVNLNGAARWLPLGPFQVQPSEFAKPILILQTVWILDRWQSLKPAARILWGAAPLVMILAVLLQPSLSMALLMSILLGVMVFVGGIPRGWLGGISLLLGAGLAFKVSQTPYQIKRLISFSNPLALAQGSGYQVTQSFLAIASGGLFGVGYGMSALKYKFLPYPYSDFIFSVFAEEFGLVGVALFLVFLMIFALLGLRVSWRFSAPRPVRLLALGTTLLLVIQSLLHLAVITGCLPPTGMPLPLVSYGGSGICAALWTCGLLIRAAREAGQPQLSVVRGQNPPLRLAKPRAF